MSVRSTSFQFSLYIYIYAFSRRFYPKRLTVHSGYTFFCQYVCSLGIEPTTFALLTQCSNHWATGTQSSLQISLPETGWSMILCIQCGMWHILSTLVSSLWHFLWIICLSSQLEMMTRTNFHPSTRMLHQLQLGPQNQKIAPLQLLQGFQLVQWCFLLPIYLAMHLHCKIHLQLSLPLFPLFSWSVIWSRTSCKDSFFAIALTRTEWQARWCEAFICSLSLC